MPNLLNCLSEPGEAVSCCESPYQPVMSDCVLDCLVREQQTVTRALRVTYGGMLEFGTKSFEAYEDQLQDMQLLTTFLYDLFLDRVASVAGGNPDWVVADVWEEHDLSCVADYFRCRYKLDIRPWLLHAGLYDPAHPPSATVMAQLPIPYEVPCGNITPVAPDPDPPLEEDCIIPTFMVVSGAVDSAYEASADPLSIYLVVSNLLSGSGGWNDHVGEIAAPGNFIVPPDPSDIAVQGSDQIWRVTGGVAQALFPVVIGSVIGQALTVSIGPIVTAGMNLLLQVSDGSSFETVYNGDPTSLGTDYIVTLSGVIVLRATYTYNGCVYGPFDTDVDDGCGQLQATFTPESLCGTNTWQIAVAITVLDDYAGGTINAVVNGVAQGAVSLVVGSTDYGPFAPGDEVHFIITHPTILGCTITTSDYMDPTTPPDLNVYLPVLFTQNTLTLVYMVSLPAVDPDLLIANPNITIVYDCGSGDVEVYNGPLNSFADMPIFPQPSCNIDTITGAIIYDQDCDVRIDAELDTFTPTDPVAGPTVGLNGGVNSSFQGPDGSYYVGGFFNRWDPSGVNVVANSFTRLNSDGTLDSTFNNVVSNPLAFTPGFNADLRDLAVDSLGRIVCVGSFTAFNDVSAARVIRINPDGTRDNTFVIGTGFDSTVNGVSIDSANNVICTGAFTTYDGVFVGHIVRLKPNGAIDTTFNYNLGLSVPYASFGTSGNSYRNVIDADGSIIVNSGQASFDAYTDVNGTTIVLPDWSLFKKGMVRLDANGTLDSIITQGAGVLGALVGPGAPTQNSFAIQSNGDIICTGAFTTYNGVTVNRIVRMDAAGNIDMGFLANTGTGFDAETAGIAVLPGGKILIGCNGGTLFNGAFTGGLVLLNSDGTRDNSLNLGAGFNGIVVDICITTTGRIIVGGTFTTLNLLPAWYVQQF